MTKYCDLKIIKDNHENIGFIQGVAYCAGWLIKAHGEDTVGLEMMRMAGYNYDDLLKAKCANYDLAPIADALDLRLDGKPRKRRKP